MKLMLPLVAVVLIAGCSAQHTTPAAIGVGASFAGSRDGDGDGESLTEPCACAESVDARGVRPVLRR
jgi:hypothetical protein